MIAALITGRGGSRSIKDKNIYPVLGRPLLAYPIISARNSKLVEDVYFSTDSDKLAGVAKEWGAKIIMRPDELGADTKHAEVMVHGHNEIKNTTDQDVEIIVILMANCPTITPGIIDKGIKILLDDREEKIDSCVTVSKYNEYNPMRARIVKDGFLMPMINTKYFFENEYIKNESGHDRDGVGDIYFCDGAAWIVRSRCMDIEKGELPYKWIGKRVVPLYQEYGMDVDNWRGIANAEFWLKRNGFTETYTPYDK